VGDSVVLLLDEGTAAEKSYRMSKALAYTMRMSAPNRFKDIGSYLESGVESQFTANSAEYAMVHSELFLPLLNSIKRADNSRARVSGSSPAQELGNMLTATSLSGAMKSKLLDFDRRMQSLKNDTTNTAKQAITREVGAFEESVHRDATLSPSDRETLVRMTVILIDNTDNFSNVASTLLKRAKVSCWICSVFNAVVTVVVATAIGIIVGTPGGVVGALAGAATGFVVGIYGVITDNCFRVVDDNFNIVFETGPC
jgi:hypothetical protein